MTLSKRIAISFILSLLLLCVFVSTCSAQTLYLETEEWTRLKTIFQQLEANNQAQLEISDQLKTALTSDRQKLEESRKELERLQRESAELKLLLIAQTEKLTAAQTSLLTAQDSLQKANESLNKLEKEDKQQIRWLKVQRFFLTVGLGYALIHKE